jgi:hypothetical protein
MARGEIVEQRWEHLRALIRRLALAWPMVGLPGALAGCSCPDVDKVYLIRQPDDATRALLDACEDPARHECKPLCDHLAGVVDGGVSSGGAGPVTHCELHKPNGDYAEVHVRWAEYCPGGRRPEGLVLSPAASTGAGALFAQVAQLEAASVPAFERLARELRAHGAPTPLAAAATRARTDERRHARVVTALAWRFGSVAPRPRLPADRDVRSLEAVAIENAVEGCARETYGALVATHQAACAADPIVRLAMTPIAADETKHAALSCAIDEWARSRLGAAARRRVDGARRAACEALARDVERPIPAAVASLAGLPDAAAARRLVGAVASLAAKAA